MQLVINTRGAFLKKEKNCFLVKNEEKIVEVSADKIDSILITTSATITTDAIEFAVENNIDIIFLDYHGNPYGRVWHSKLGSTTLIRRRQLEAEAADTGFYLARGWIAEKIQNQIDLLKDLKKNRSDQKDQIDISIAKIEGLRETLLAMKGSLDIKRGSIMGVEGMASATYFDAIAGVMPEQWKFKGRSGTRQRTPSTACSTTGTACSIRRSSARASSRDSIRTWGSCTPTITTSVRSCSISSNCSGCTLTGL